jgi:hypothetical protein
MLADLIDNENQIIIGNEDIQIIYAQPKTLKSDANYEVLDFLTISDEIIKSFPNSKLMTRFASSLKNWAKD